ncbi:MAG: cellulase family glycosylhydrolase [Kiritimatiellae bacterium]|nr:cellulase family glycosylhydrolase [Kiritimatiellia bacterium]
MFAGSRGGLAAFLLSAGVFAAACAPAADPGGRAGPWTKEKAWTWHCAQPWMRGCNYMPASAAGFDDMWQEHGSEARFKAMDRELALAEKTGFNVMRFLVSPGAWMAEHDGFMARFERSLALLGKHKMRAIVVLGNDCSVPKERWKPFKSGPQDVDWGCHGGKKAPEHGSMPDAVGYTILDDPELNPKFYAMCEELVAKYRSDPRIAFWNLWNEPGNNNRGRLTLPHLRKLFELCWRIDPIQPLAADVWCDRYGMGFPSGENVQPARADREAAQQLAGELSDIVSYHCYEPYDRQVTLIRDLRRFYGRPLVNTEWLARTSGCNVADCYPLFYVARVGAVNWGLVAGRFQAYEPREGMWKEIERGGGKRYDMTKWFHDLYRPSHRPYDPREIDLIKRFNRLADEDFAALTKNIGM